MTSALAERIDTARRVVDRGRAARAASIVVEVDRGDASLEVIVSGGVIPRLDALPGARSRRDGRGRVIYSLPGTPTLAAALDVRLAKSGAQVDWSRAAWRLRQARTVQTERLERYRDYKTAELEPLPWPTSIPPWRHQLAAIRACPEEGGYLLYLRMGVGGKTRISLDILRLRQATRVLVITPRSVAPAWATQVEIYHPGAWRVTVLDDGSVARRRKTAEVALRAPIPQILVINREAVWREPFGSLTLEQPWDVVIVDEIQRLKSPSGKESRFAARLADRVPLRLGLSGTPLSQGAQDAYGIMRFLDKGIFGTSEARYANRYLIKGGYEGRQVVGVQREDEWKRRFYSITFRATDDDLVDLPTYHHIERTCSLSGEARRIYQELAEDLITEIEADPERKTITAASAMVKILKLQQVAGGGLIDEEGGRHIVHEAKAKLLQEVLEELDREEPVVVFARFQADLDLIHHAAAWAGRTSLELSGRRRDLSRWQGGEAEVLAVQIQSGGVGIDLTRARYAIYFSQTWSLGDYEQSLARVHRPGQTRPVTYVHLITRGTVDRVLRRALTAKADAVEAILREPWKLKGDEDL